ncbi:MAG: sigma-70 family RNA polymerase sigma factor [Oscillospiraceae bacterium]|nr:sigma-70 family RNA polymerase sigma factor [Oscillospiraceae bacterium]
MSDSEIINLILVSKEKGYSALTNSYVKYVYAIVCSVIGKYGTKEDVEECITDIFVKLIMDTSWINNDITSLKSYIGAVARNTAVNVYHRLSGHIRYISDEDIPEVMMSSSSPEEQISGNEMKEIFWENVKKLGSPDSDILIAQYLYGIPVKDIAPALNMTAGAVHKRSRRARKKLEAIFNEQIESGKLRKEDYYETS